MTRITLDPRTWLDQPGLAGEVNTRLTHEGILVAAQATDGRLNPMTIGWGTFGSIWGRPLFVVLVRPSRHTYACIEHSGDYTVNVLPPDHRQAVALCGRVSGRDVDKLAETGLTPLPSTQITSAGLAEANLVFECRVVHHNDVQGPTFPTEIVSNYYAAGDFHRVYFGQIMAVSGRADFLQRP